MKRKTKKPVSVLLCTVLLLSLIPLTAFADESKAVKITEESKTAELVTDTAKFISLDEAKEIALKDAELDRNKQKITFTKEELSRNKGRPCYLLDFYTGENQYHYEIDAKTGEVIYGRRYILLTEAKKIAVDDAGCTEKVTFTEEELVDGGIKTPYYRLVFADNKTQWTYRINAVSGDILEKKEENIGEADLISLEKAKSIVLNDAGLIENAEKIVFTKEELIRNQGKPYYLLEFYTGKYQYHYEIDAKTGDIIYGRRYILLADAKRIAVDDAECSDKVTFLEEELVDGGIKTPYYLLVFADNKTQWTYRINAISGAVMGKHIDDISGTNFISLEEAKKIALKDAKLDEYAQKIVFTKTELNRSQGRPCYILEFYTGKYQYHYEIDAKTGDIIYGRRYILLADAKRIAVDDAECSDKVTFLEEELVDGGIKTPYYLLVFADNKTQWTYRINAISGAVMGKHIDDISGTNFISLEEAKKIALKDAKLDEYAQKIVFTKTELNRSQGRPCYILEFYTGKYQYHYEIDAKTGEIIYGRRYILLADAKKIAVDDAGCTEKVVFTEEELVDGGIKTPYYRLVFTDRKTQWTYRINAVSGAILEKKSKNTDEPDYISLEEAKKIALKDAELDKYAQKIVFTKTELNRYQGKQCYLLEFYTGKNQYYYQIDAKTGDIIYGRRYILLADAKKIAVDDAECSDRVTFLEEELVDGGIKTPYYLLVFADNKTQWTYRINAVTGGILKKKQKDIKVKPDNEWENPFGDVKKRDWFYFSVKFAYDFGLMKGTTEMEFSPDSYVTRAMFVMIIYRMEKEPQAGGSVFVDVEIGGYYDRAVAWANANGIVSGVSKDRFAPNDPITREQMATILYRYANFKGYDIESNGNTAYSDSSSISGYARNAVSWAAANLLMKGDDDGSFLPNANATRAQAAAVFARMIENLE